MLSSLTIPPQRQHDGKLGQAGSNHAVVAALIDLLLGAIHRHSVLPIRPEELQATEVNGSVSSADRFFSKLVSVDGTPRMPTESLKVLCPWQKF